MATRRPAAYLMFICLAQTSLVLGETGDVFQFLQEEAKVTTASKRAESVQDAPGIITVITADEIHRYGAQNVAEILQRAPSIYTLGSYLYPSNVVSMRGDLETHVDNHVLWLINGRPVREVAFGGVNVGLLTSFPVDLIDHIEIVRGPGSVLYGSNAYEGVINIITKQAHEKDAEANTGGGSFGTGYGGAMVALPLKDGGIAGAARYSHSDGWLYSAKDERRASGSFYTQEGDTSFATADTYKDLTVTGFYSDNHNVTMNSIPIFVAGATPLNTIKAMGDIGYKHAFNENWSVGVNETYNSTQINTPFPGSDAQRNGTSILTEATIYGKLLDKINVVTGGSGDYQETEFVPENLHPNETLWSYYAQADFRLMRVLKVLGGMQYNKPEGIPGHVSPRAGLIANFTPEWGSKLLYGEAYRAPYLGETHFNEPPILTGNPTLLPEMIKTYDAQIFRQSRLVKSSLTYFNSEQNERISRAVVNGNVTYVNSGELFSQGLELEGTVTPNNRLSLTGSYTYQTNRDQNGVHDATFMPNNMLKTGVSYVADAGITASLFNTYFGERGDVSAVNPTVLEINPPQQSL